MTPFFSLKKSQNLAHIRYCQGKWNTTRLDIEVPDTCDCVTSRFQNFSDTVRNRSESQEVTNEITNAIFDAIFDYF